MESRKPERKNGKPNEEKLEKNKNKKLKNPEIGSTSDIFQKKKAQLCLFTFFRSTTVLFHSLGSTQLCFIGSTTVLFTFQKHNYASQKAQLRFHWKHNCGVHFLRSTVVLTSAGSMTVLFLKQNCNFHFWEAHSCSLKNTIMLHRETNMCFFAVCFTRDFFVKT